jgi:hypothetical protein
MEPARAGWSFNKWQKTRIPKVRRQLRPSRQRRHRSVPALAAALVAAAVPVGVVVAAAVDVADLAVVAPVVVAEPAAAVVVAADRAAARAARAVNAAVGAVSARVATAMVDAETAAASSSRT